jgi:glyoxylase-like metal-dependent hydrolase (beta-lactamase superfamily II)
MGTALRRPAIPGAGRRKVLRAPGSPTIEPVAEGVWLIRGGVPRIMNVYLLEDDGGATVFDAGIKGMAKGITEAAAAFGGIKRVVLGHGHTDHRGAAPRLDAPVYCHPDEVEDAEGSGGFRYWGDIRKSNLPRQARLAHPLLHNHVWDGGPVRIAGTVSEGDDVAGFRVVHAPGHAPGLIALFRDEDRVALVSDLFYTIDMGGHASEPHVPDNFYNWDTELARTAIRKVAELEPDSAWPGHGNPLVGDVGAQLRHAADTT